MSLTKCHKPSASGSTRVLMGWEGSVSMIISAELSPRIVTETTRRRHERRLHPSALSPVELVHRGVDAVGEDLLHGVGGFLDRDRHLLSKSLAEATEDVVGALLL